MSNFQQQLNAVALKNGIKIAIFNGWKVTDKHGNVYLVQSAAELHDLIDNLVKAANDGH